MFELVVEKIARSLIARSRRISTVNMNAQADHGMPLEWSWSLQELCIGNASKEARGGVVAERSRKVGC